MYFNPQLTLKQAYTLIDENGWTQYASARTAKGDAVESINPLATSWDAEGAIDAMLSRHGGPAGSYDEVIAVFKAHSGCGTNMAAWNDHPARTKEEVLEAFERAIKAC